jgi:hypothetical protein
MKKILNERRRMQQLAGILSEMKVEGGELEVQIREFEKLHEKFTEAKKHFMSIEADFRVAEDVVRKALESIDETEERMLELEDIAVRIKAKGSTKTTFPYKLGFETLLAQVNSAIAAQIDKLMQSEMKMHEVKSTIELKRKGLDESLSVSKIMSKAGEFVTNLFARLGDYFTKSNQKLDGYIGELRGMLNDGGQEEGNLFEGMLNEVDASVMGGIAKNLYLYLGKMKPNNPLDINGAPLKNVKGEIIKKEPKVKMIYQNASAGLNNLAMQGKAKELEKSHQGNQNSSEITLWYSMDYINALGFAKKEEADAALQEILKKYGQQVTGSVQTNKMDYEWAKDYAPTYSITINMKSDKEIAKGQSAKPAVQQQPAQQPMQKAAE